MERRDVALCNPVRAAMQTAVPWLIVGAIGSFLGAKPSARWMPSARLKQL